MSRKSNRQRARIRALEKRIEQLTWTVETLSCSTEHGQIVDMWCMLREELDVPVGGSLVETIDQLKEKAEGKSSD